MESKPPSTLEGIKRLAKRIKKEKCIQHSDALNEAAKVAGYENFRHAQNKLNEDNRDDR